MHADHCEFVDADLVDHVAQQLRSSGLDCRIEHLPFSSVAKLWFQVPAYAGPEALEKASAAVRANIERYAAIAQAELAACDRIMAT